MSSLFLLTKTDSTDCMRLFFHTWCPGKQPVTIQYLCVNTFLLRIHTRIWVWCRCSLCTHFCPEAIHSFVYPYISFLLLLPFKMGPSMTKCSKCVLHSYVLGMHENNTISYQCSDTMCEHCMALMGK